jgi:hypothetical protein
LFLLQSLSTKAGSDEKAGHTLTIPGKEGTESRYSIETKELLRD